MPKKKNMVKKMTTPQPLYPAPSSYTGLIHYANSLSFIEFVGSTNWAVLIFDRPFTGSFDFQRAQQTAASMKQHYPEGSQATLSGILINHIINGQNTPVLHLI
jgi:hypothetical protein